MLGLSIGDLYQVKLIPFLPGDTPMRDGKEPLLWFHDIYRKDKTVFSTYEVKFIKSLSTPTAKK